MDPETVKGSNSAANRKSVALLYGFRNNIIVKNIFDFSFSIGKKKERNTATLNRPINCKTFVLQKH